MIKQNADGSYSGDLAESWEANEDSSAITFKLREGIKWHGGEAFTADDINNAQTWNEPMGTGAFIYADAVDGERMEFTANADYYLDAPDMDKLVEQLLKGEGGTIVTPLSPLSSYYDENRRIPLGCIRYPAAANRPWAGRS